MTAPIWFNHGPITAEETRALKALEKGEATSHQQQLALATIIKKFAATHDEPFIAGQADATGFMAGRGFVGRRILLHLKQSFAVLHPNEKETLND